MNKLTASGEYRVFECVNAIFPVSSVLKKTVAVARTNPRPAHYFDRMQNTSECKTTRPVLQHRTGHWLGSFIALLTSCICADAQEPPTTKRDSLATLTVRVRRDTAQMAGNLEAATVRINNQSARSDARGIATMRIGVGSYIVRVTKLGFRPDSARLELTALTDTTLSIGLVALPADIGAVIVSSTRAEKRVEDNPLRVEVIDEEELAEKVSMAPGDIGMMLNETSGLRVQATNPSLGGANVRIQGLRGRYTLILADGLPLYGGQTGGLGLLQIPPVDLGRVEVIKGSASALYGSSALGGVIDLISRRAGDEPEQSALANVTSRGGADGVYFGAAPISEHVDATLLIGAHHQTRNDIDSDGWTDMPGYSRIVARPRVYFDNHRGRSVFFTGGITDEDRSGGTLESRTTPDGTPYAESLRTRRWDIGALARIVGSDSQIPLGIHALRRAIFTMRGSAVEQRHTHQFGVVPERDKHNTWFGEATLALPKGAATYVAGAAFQQDAFHSESVAGFDYSYSIPALFAQVDVDARSWLSLSTSVRADAHSKYGTFVNPRVSLLFRAPNGESWTARLSGGTGAFAPTPFVEETEVTGLSPLAPLNSLVAERATSGSLDISTPMQTSWGVIEFNATVFASRITDPLEILSLSSATPSGASRFAITNAAQPTRTYGGELLARVERSLSQESEEAPTLRVTSTYAYLRSTECANFGLGAATTITCARRDVPLTPRHSASVVATIEQEGKSRLGLELYYTGKQQLIENPYRITSAPYLIVGLMGERVVETRAGAARLFLNLENITNVRQSRYDPLLLPHRGSGGRWTTDAWTDLAGFTVNGGVRFTW